jgi:RNA polymerase sigma-70 factor (ECF subfamily)
VSCARSSEDSGLPKKFLNKPDPPVVFMNEDAHLVAEEAILNEAATVVRSPDRSEDARLESLVRQHSRMVYRIAYAVLRSHHDAEDAAQETFLRVLRYSHKLASVENGKTWLARIAWRVAVDRSQQRGRRREIALDDPEKPVGETASSDFPAHQVVHGSQVGELLEKLIAALPGKLRQPLILSTLEEMSPVEVAATLGMNEAAVRSRVFRARQILREKLAGSVTKKHGR